jgi:hypothetical protein
MRSKAGGELQRMRGVRMRSSNQENRLFYGFHRPGRLSHFLVTKKTGGFHGFHRPGRLSHFPMRPVLCSLCLGSSGVSPPLPS